MSSSLLTTRRFAPLFWTQFFAAFSDNFLKQALIFLVLFKIAGPTAHVLVTLAPAVFIFPYFFLSAFGGEMADRYDKAYVAQRIKFAEIGVSALAVLGFWLHTQGHDTIAVSTLFFALFGFGVCGALFGPIKYGILPDHLAHSELPAGNALVEGATFIAILLGTIVGGVAAQNGGDPASFGFLMILFSLACWGSSLFIPPTGQGAPDLVIRRNVLVSTVSLLNHLRDDRRIWWGAFVTSWFWLAGAVVTVVMQSLVKDVLGGTEEVITTCNAIFAISIAIGSGLAAWLAAGRIILLPTLIGGVLLGLFALDIGLSTMGAQPIAGLHGYLDIFKSGRGLRFVIGLSGIAISGGLFIVPVFSAIQAWAGPDRRARVIAGVNVLNAGFMAASAGIVAVLQGAAGLSTSGVFVVLGVGSLLVAVAIYRTMPASAFSDLLSIIYRTLFRIEVHGIDHLNNAGPNVIVALNHVSFLDAGLALSLRNRKPVFAIDVGIAKRWWVRPFVKLTGALPLDPLKPMAVRTLIDAVKAGNALIIFPEGRITVTGSLMKVYDGAAMIADKSDAEIVPVRIEGLEQTPFSRLSKSQVRRKWFPKVKVTILEPVKLSVDPEIKGRKRRLAAGAALYGIMSDLVFRTTSTDRTVIQAVIQAADTHGRNRVAVEDPVTGALTYKKLLVGAAVLGAKLMRLGPEGHAIGVMLPNANGAAVTVIALMSAGRVPAMINFSAGAANVLAACKAAQIDTILTSRVFIDKGKLTNLVAAIEKEVKLVYLEDIRATVTFGDKIRGLLHADKPLVPRKADDWAAILFTSGSEGVPKGVVLSHRNMLANAAQAAARIDFGREDKVFNVLPLFHSFGLTVGLILPLVSGVQIYLYPSPLHYRTVAELIYGVNATILFGTDTFLNGYARVAHPYDFRSLRYILAGAEAVKEATRRTYLEKFGLRILEGYGVTETAPVLALNTPMFNKFGSVGRILPGMEARLDKVEGVDEGGRLFVRGPNVMLGYLKVDKPGVLEPPEEGWHDTGDIVTIDEQGFISIKGRAKRFAKIGGEMISLAAVEVLAGELWPNDPSAVVAVPDLRKGERLILVTQKKDATRPEFQAFAKSKHASDLMIPAEVWVLDKLPMLGTGKADMMSLGKLVHERIAEKAQAQPETMARAAG
jgi:acyl-[acyl-carrier-protein]-phospholipid O-acyltransferase / long-chain-fatty-acid--[acyl-carrier-protein] ligase